MTNTPHDRVEVVLSADAPVCPRCCRNGLLSARLPHDIIGRRAVMRGTHVVVLCEACDVGDAAAGALITFFAVHERIDDTTLTEAAPLIAAWTASIQIPQVDPEAWETDYQAWLRGEFDD
ncbi:DUF6300 family protein [Frankia gtarii]|uniref:DUF6300 family protein n=1 Tax=Frankia gtarii TaxID=2950102 RepID=UPI0027E07AFE|nr:DUF6300 family protein [Frankia gtarii]